MSIERHRLQREKNAGAYMEPAPDGNWVTFADHAAELARVEKLLDAARDAARVAIDQMDVWQRACAAGSLMHTRTLTANALLRAECEAAREFEQFILDEEPGPSVSEVNEWMKKHNLAHAKKVSARAATDAAGILKGGE